MIHESACSCNIVAVTWFIRIRDCIAHGTHAMRIGTAMIACSRLDSLTCVPSAVHSEIGGASSTVQDVVIEWYLEERGPKCHHSSSKTRS